MLIKGVPLAKVMTIVGHSTIKTNMRVLQLAAQDTQGATESIVILLPRDLDTENVANLFQKEGKSLPILTNSIKIK